MGMWVSSYWNFWSGSNRVVSVYKDKLSFVILYKVDKWTSFPVVLKDSSSMKSYCNFSREHLCPAIMTLFFKYIVERTTDVTWPPAHCGHIGCEIRGVQDNVLKLEC